MMWEVKDYAIAEDKNTAYAAGYRYYCSGNYKILNTTDPWSGMPNTSGSTFFFTDKEEAEAFAQTQYWVFSHTHPDVYELPPHTETWEEQEKRLEKEQADKKAKRLARELAKAEAEGLTLEEYRSKKKLEKKIRDTESEIENLKMQLIKKEKYLAYLKNQKND